MKCIFGYWQTLQQYLATDKGAYDFYDALFAIFVMLFSMATALILAVIFSG